MQIIAFITDGPTVRDILAHSGEPIAPAQGPPRLDLPAAGAGGGDPRTEPVPEYQFDQGIAW